VHIANNLTNKLIRSRDGGSGIVESNIDQAQSTWFVNPAEGELHLVSDLPVDGLILTDEVPDDIDQTPRYIGSGFEIGADEMLATGSSDPIQDVEINVFPNPGSGKFNINGNSQSMSAGKIEVYDAYGNRVVVMIKRCCEIDLSDQPDGLYFVKFIVGNSWYIQKLTLCRN